MTKDWHYKNIGFISTRIAGTDGVSLEIEKWAHVLERNGCRCFYFSGENDRETEKCMLVEEAHFMHPDIQNINDQCYGRHVRSSIVTSKIHQIREHLKEQLYDFVRRFDIDLIIPENVLAIPLNTSLGLGLVEFIAETGMIKLPIVCSSIPPFMEIGGEDVCMFSLDDSPYQIARKMLDFVKALKPQRMFRKVIGDYAWDNIYHNRLLPYLNEVVEDYRHENSWSFTNKISA